ncbi:hypothetical protein B296_00034555 [Ensete ventricosum]|uniref:Uncharacterized protein n=1 Tax=Ensete ventricosum TaxID=4639 RepID=A0A426XGA2_ENSVE|nr:hypothetical protein B296_00034555 [Ensete ventricosum]
MRTFRSSAWAYDQRTTHQRYYLMGRNNVLNRLDRAAKTIAFDVPVEEVQEVLNAQPGPEPLAGRRARGGSLSSNLPGFEGIVELVCRFRCSLPLRSATFVFTTACDRVSFPMPKVEDLVITDQWHLPRRMRMSHESDKFLLKSH